MVDCSTTYTVSEQHGRQRTARAIEASWCEQLLVRVRARREEHAPYLVHEGTGAARRSEPADGALERVEPNIIDRAGEYSAEQRERRDAVSVVRAA